MGDTVRIDKWLQVARVFKTRSLAQTACERSRVTVNGQVAKAHRKVGVDDRVEVDLGDWTRILVIKEVRDKPIAKALVPGLFEDLSPPRPVLDPLERLMRRAPVSRERGLGRPSKRDRRKLDQLREREPHD